MSSDRINYINPHQGRNYKHRIPWTVRHPVNLIMNLFIECCQAQGPLSSPGQLLVNPEIGVVIGWSITTT